MLVSYFPDIRCFVAFSKFEEKDIAKSAGWRWDASTRRWFTSDAAKARLLERYADASAKAQLATVNAHAVSAIEASKAETADIDIPCPPGLAFMPYQRAGIAYALSRDSCLIGDEMGLGKTIQAIGVANKLCQVEIISLKAPPPSPLLRVLIVCPASLRLNWVREWKRWHIGRVRPVVVKDSWPLALRGNDLLAEPVAAIMSYESVVKWKQINKLEWDLAIFDEAHYLKTPKAKRTRAVFGYQRANHPDHIPPLRAKRRIALTGTPIVNRPLELWPLVHAFDPTGLGSNYRDYKERYVDPCGELSGEATRLAYMKEHPRDYAGAYTAKLRVIKAAENARMAELHDRLRASFMVRRLKADVLQDLPAKRRQIVLLEIEGMTEIIAAEKRALDKVRADAQIKRQAIDLLQRAGDAASHAAAVRSLSVWRGAAMTEISRIRHETAVAKLPAVIEHIFGVLEETPKLVVFGHHHDVIDGLKAALPDASVVFDGRMNDREKSDVVVRFQSDAGCRLFIGSIRAAGLGITLTAASCVCFAELDWTPSGMVQAEDRLHRIGQKDVVLVQHLVVDGSIDQKMADLLVKKAEMIDAILDGKVPADAGESVLDGVLRGDG